MRQKITWLILCIIITLSAFSQAPQGIYYQAVVRDSSGNLLQNSPASFRFTIYNGSPVGNIVYQQTDTVVTDQMGLITVILGGGGSIIQGNFNTIPWGTGTKFLGIEVDPAGGTNYTNMGTTQMMSVPYALYAASAGSTTDTTWLHQGTDIYNGNVGNVGINTATPQATLDVNGFTILGENSPKIKMTKITGITPSILGGSTSVNLGIPNSKILSVLVQVDDPLNGLIAPLTLLTGREYNYSVVSSVFKLTLSLTNSLLILNKPYKALIVYEE